jgi:hypothetical protein
MLYQRRNLATGEDVGEPAELPASLQGFSDAILADLSAALDPQACAELGYTKVGFYPEDPAPRWIHKAVFKRRFTAEERIAIRLAALNDPILADFMDVLDSTDRVFLDDFDLIAGLGYLVAQQLIGSGRPSQIRA